MLERRLGYVFLHGGGQGGWVWRETIDALRAQGGDRIGTVLALDVPGCGSKRDRDTSGISPGDVATELLKELQDAGLQDVVLVGHSQAGTILPLMAEQRPSLFRRLIYISACAPLAEQTIPGMIGLGAYGSHSDEVGWPVPLGGDTIESRVPSMICNDMSDSEAAAFVALLGEDSWPNDVTFGTGWDYGNCGATSSSYVICLRDGVLPVSWQEKFAARLKAQRIVRVDAGHQVMNTQPQALAKILWAEAAVETG